MDVSYDSNLLATGSADRSVKIWGLDFGATVIGKDSTIKQWDADNFQKIVTLEGHQAEVWALAISPDGRHEAVIPREGGKDELGLAAKKTTETVKIAERLLEAIDVYREHKEKLREYEAERKASAEPVAPPAPHPLMTVYQTTCPERYMLETLRRIRYSELEETLLVLPFGYVVDLLKALAELLSRNWEAELCCRCLFFLLRVHSGQIGATSALVSTVDRLRLCTLNHLDQARDEVGFNLAGLDFLQREIDAREEVALFTDATRAFKERKKRKTKKERAILSVVAS
ncbi:hypothetical protein MRX96_044566 [Rhipicephalus microplus]